jgi:hypothetical protein
MGMPQVLLVLFRRKPMVYMEKINNPHLIVGILLECTDIFELTYIH